MVYQRQPSQSFSHLIAWLIVLSLCSSALQPARLQAAPKYLPPAVPAAQEDAKDKIDPLVFEQDSSNPVKLISLFG